MKWNASFRRGRSLAVVVTAMVVGCAGETPVGPSASSGTLRLDGVTVSSTEANRIPSFEGCDSVRVAAGSQLAFRVYGVGAQIYRWTGSAWIFVAPSADLFADAGDHGKVGTHFGGPTWKTNSGSTVVGATIGRCTPDASAIPWLLLDVVSNEGDGVFHGVTQIQRLNTVGGKAPSTPGSFTGETVNVPYTADYLFYRAP